VLEPLTMGRLRAPKRPSARRAAGLTLIELMVVVAIAAIILGLAAPSFSEYIVTQRLRSIHAQMATDLQFARSEAVARSAFVSVRFQEVTETGAMTCYIIFTRPDPTTSTDTCDCTASAGARCSTTPPVTTTELRTVTIPAELKVSVRTPTGQTDTLTFDARSGALRFPPSDSAIIVSSGFQVESSADATRALRATVSPAGRAELCTPTGSKLGGSPC
jgi:prepilin-type N-terminal cleavage/methylation domain-containing protein